MDVVDARDTEDMPHPLSEPSFPRTFYSLYNRLLSFLHDEMCFSKPLLNSSLVDSAGIS